MKGDKPRILILGKLPPPFIGPALATEILLKSHLNRDFNLIHLNTNLNRSVSDLGNGGIKKIFGNILLYIRFWRILKTQELELVLVPISQTSKGFLKDGMFIWIASRFSIKIVIQLRGSNFLNWQRKASQWMNNFTRKRLKSCHAVIVLGVNLKYLFSDFFDMENIYAIPNGGDYPVFQQKEFSKIRFCYISNFLPGKGFKIILEALAKLPDDLKKNIVLNAYGSWDNADYLNQCKKIISIEKLDFVNVHPAITGDEKIQALYNSDVFVFTPIHPEGHPWSIVEAISAGLPIISTNEGAISQSVINYYNGILLDQINSDELTKAIQAISTNDSLRKEMGENSRRLYKKLFTEKIMIENYRSMFNELLMR